MKRDSALRFIDGQLLIYRTRLEGMIAANQQAILHKRDTLPWTQDSFDKLEAEMERVIGHNAIISFFEHYQD